MNDVILPIIFFAIAFFYSSIGFGGGSSYLALLSLLVVDFYEIRTLALIFNLIVVSISTVIYIKDKIFDFKLFIPFIISSMPLAFIATQIRLSETIFFIILGGSLITSGVFMWAQNMKKVNYNAQFTWLKRSAIGGFVGFLSGLVGIGGGIFLSPILNIYRWENSRKIAALASAFILINSISGLLGLYQADTFRFNASFSFPILFAVFIGGVLGSLISRTKLNFNMIRNLTALLVCYVGLRLILFHWLGLHI